MKRIIYILLIGCISLTAMGAAYGSTVGSGISQDSLYISFGFAGAGLLLWQSLLRRIRMQRR